MEYLYRIVGSELKNLSNRKEFEDRIREKSRCRKEKV